ncbi:8-amino-7-oxononanoate synthase [uncultured Thiodictyon sp.]|uniref:aminotransferase class I/II-fold pyridoxal phosphate-dependent enzyme n=1 Tax=uncultured Thiodictyon sp. TaxID=1846217 RepID=UPI0025FCBBC1|nr:8-amino-7-oxononanoate synthase [uncultured Thiodictyon sp.]
MTPNDLSAELERRRAAGLYRRRRVQDGPQQPQGRTDGRPMLNFGSNDYLGLANHPQVITALQQGAARWGVGSGSAHLVNGHSAAHQALEEELAEFTGQPRALLFSTGYMANLGVISALAGRGDTVFEDRLNHASLLDAAVLSRATLRRYPHADAAELAHLLDADRRHPGRDAGTQAMDGNPPTRDAAQNDGAPHPNAPCLIATDGVFSMDGDLAPLPALALIARQTGAWLLVDDAHGLGVLGREGRGSLDHFGLLGAPADGLILMGTLGKAFGTFGAFVAGSDALIETLIQRARPYIYTTATPPALAEATRVSLALARREEWRREHLKTLIGRFRAGAAQLGLPLADSPTPIQPLTAGSSEHALAWSRTLESAGILVTAIRPPTVPAGTARLRITLSAAHTQADVELLLSALATLPRVQDQ